MKKREVFGVNWIGLLRSLQAEIMGLVGALLAILVIWLVVRSVIGRGVAVLPKRDFARGPTGARHCWRSSSLAACYGM
jgi:hypothetical protein